jgi:hypothetical protein
MKRKLLTETPVCPRKHLVIISYTTELPFAKERIGPLAAIITTIFYLLALYLSALPNTPENPFASIYSETSIKTTCQHLLLLVGFDTMIHPLYLWVISQPWAVQGCNKYTLDLGCNNWCFVILFIHRTVCASEIQGLALKSTEILP